MEKISGIVSGSRRVSSADLSQGSAVRPGAPSFGRPMGVSTQGLKDNLTTAQRAIAEQQKLTDQRRLSTQLPETVQQLADRFFMQPPVPTNQVSAPVMESDLKIAGPDPALDSPSAVGVDDERNRQAAISEDEPAGYVPRGSYIDVNA